MQAVDLSNNTLRKQGTMAALAWAHALPAMRVLRMRWADVSASVQHDVNTLLWDRVKISW